MAIELESIATPVDFDYANPIISDLTVTDANLIIVQVMTKDGTAVLSVNRDDENFTLLTTAGYPDHTRVEIWYLLNPSPGTKPITVNIPACEGICGAMGFVGVDVSDPIGDVQSFQAQATDHVHVTLHPQRTDSWLIAFVGEDTNESITCMYGEWGAYQIEAWELIVGGPPAGRKGAEATYQNTNVSTSNDQGFDFGGTVLYSAMIAFEIKAAVPYSLTLEVDKAEGYVGDTFTFYGTLTQNGTPISGATVVLYKDDASTDLSDITDDNGNYSIPWMADEVGTHEFYTEATW